MLNVKRSTINASSSLNFERSTLNAPLPTGWRWEKLGKICCQDRQIVIPDGEDISQLPYVGLEHVESETGRILLESYIPSSDEVRSTTFLFNEKHVLYGKLRPYLNKVALPDFQGRCTTELIPLLPNSEVMREFLAFVLRRQETVDFAMRGITGSRMPRANIDELLKYEIPLPPLSEQKRIVKVLNEQMAAVEKARKEAEEQLSIIKVMPSALLRKAFRGEL